MKLKLIFLLCFVGVYGKKDEDAVLGALLNGVDIDQIANMIKNVSPDELSALKDTAMNMLNSMNESPPKDGQPGNLQAELLNAIKDNGMLKDWQNKLSDALYTDKPPQKESQESKPTKVAAKTDRTPVQPTEEKVIKPSPAKDVQKKPSKPSIKKAKPQTSIFHDYAPMMRMALKAAGTDPMTGELLMNLAENFLKDATADTLYDMASSLMNPDDAKGAELKSMLTMASMMMGGGTQGPASAGIQLFGIAQSAYHDGFNATHFEKLLKLASSYFGASTGKGGANHEESVVNKILDLAAPYLSIPADAVRHIKRFLWDVVGAKDWPTALANIREITGMDLEDTFHMLSNTDLKEEVIDSVATAMADWILSMSQTEKWAQNVFYVNAFLSGKGLPTLDPRNLIPSVGKVLDEVSRQYFGYELEATPYLQEFLRRVKSIFGYRDEDAFDIRQVNRAQLVAVLRGFQKNEVIDPTVQLWEVFSKANTSHKCAKYLLCTVNNPNSLRTTLGSKDAFMRSGSIITAWAISSTNHRAPPFGELFEAATHGYRGEDCAVYGKQCNYLLADKVMSIEYNHSEL